MCAHRQMGRGACMCVALDFVVCIVHVIGVAAWPWLGGQLVDCFSSLLLHCFFTVWSWFLVPVFCTCMHSVDMGVHCSVWVWGAICCCVWQLLCASCLPVVVHCLAFCMDYTHWSVVCLLHMGASCILLHSRVISGSVLWGSLQSNIHAILQGSQDAP